MKKFLNTNQSNFSLSIMPVQLGLWLLLCIFISTNPAFSQQTLKANFTPIDNFGQELPSGSVFKSWKNEMLFLVLKIESEKDEPLTVEVNVGSQRMDAEIYQLAYVLGDFSAGKCGHDKSRGTFKKAKFPDRSVQIHDNNVISDSTTHYVLIKIDVDEGINRGKYPLEIQLHQKHLTAKAAAEIQILNKKLPSLDNLEYKVDFWQYPMSVADFYKVEPWSEAHYKHLEVMFEQLKFINQKVVTAAVFWDPFNSKIRDVSNMMIQVKKNKDGLFSYDYSNFEKLVEFAASKGIDEQIAVHNLYSLNNNFFYYDETTKKVITLNSIPMTDAYVAFWEPFLKDFSSYLIQKGWLEKVRFYVDERDPKVTIGLARFIKKINPNFEIGFAGNFDEELSPYVADYSVPINRGLGGRNLEKRIDLGYETTIYTGCFNTQPNMLMSSNYGDIYFLLMLAKAKNFNGMLRWAFNIWSGQIMDNAIFVDLPAGDAHFVYPEGQVSLRYWLIRDGLEEVLKADLRSNRSRTRNMIKKHNEYSLLGTENERINMVRDMKNFLNE